MDSGGGSGGSEEHCDVCLRSVHWRAGRGLYAHLLRHRIAGRPPWRRCVLCGRVACEWCVPKAMKRSFPSGYKCLASCKGIPRNRLHRVGGPVRLFLRLRDRNHDPATA